MELLVVTLAYTTPAKDTDTLAQVQLVSETVRSAPGSITSRAYRGRGSSPCYAILTTWENEEAWKKAQERHNPKQLLSVATRFLVSPPEQWLFSYVWGYSRPAEASSVAAIHLATVRPEQADVAQRGWVEGLRRQAAQHNLAFAFLARGLSEQSTIASSTEETIVDQNIKARAQGSAFISLLNWSSESKREDFYADPDYTAVSRFISSIGTIQIFALEPL